MNIWRFWANGTGQLLCIEQKLQNQIEIDTKFINTNLESHNVLGSCDGLVVHSL